MGKLLAISAILLSFVVLQGCGSAQAINPEDVVVGKDDSISPSLPKAKPSIRIR